MKKTMIVLAATAVAGAAYSTATAQHAAPHHLNLPPASDFAAKVDNQWFPLRPGTVLTSKGESDGVPATDNAMLVQETTPLEPGVVDHKVYIRGVGTVSEETVKGGNERFELVSVRRK